MPFSKIDVDSPNSITTALNFFDVPPTNVSINNASYREHLTLNPLSSKPFHFKIHANSSFVDLSKCYLFTEMAIRKVDDKGQLVVPVATESVSTIQAIGTTFIRNMKISINGREIFDANSLYSYKSYLDYELSYPLHVKNSYLATIGYYEDGTNQSSEADKGVAKRRELFKHGRSAQFITKIDSDLFNQDLYLVNNVEIDIEIMPQDDNFLILTPTTNTNDYVMDIISCKLYVKNIDLMDGLALDITRRLETTPTRYAIRKSMTKSLFITEGRTEVNANLFTEQVPRRIILGMVENSAYVGNKHLSPFQFKPFGVREISITANGHSYPSVPYDLNFDAMKFMRPFHDCNECLGFANTYESNGITPDKYKEGWCLFVFNLTNSLEDDQCFDLIKNGTSAVNIKFNTAIPSGGVTLIAMGEVDALIMMDKNRTLTSDVTV